MVVYFDSEVCDFGYWSLKQKFLHPNTYPSVQVRIEKIDNHSLCHEFGSLQLVRVLFFHALTIIFEPNYTSNKLFSPLNTVLQFHSQMFAEDSYCFLFDRDMMRISEII